VDYSKSSQILNRHIFAGDKRSLLENIADYPERYIGLFRPTKPKAKIIQNLLQSHEIRFGDAIEELLKAILSEMGFSSLPERINNDAGEMLSIDQYFTDGKIYYFIEQKIRDDHDSTKKRGQIRNFETKLEILSRVHPNQLVGIMYFIDPDFKKNKNYYHQQLATLSDFYHVPLHLFYGPEFYRFISHLDLWDELIGWLERWKSELPDFPEVNFDLDPEKAYIEIKDMPLGKWRRLVMNDRLWQEGIIQVVFRDGSTLRAILSDFQQKDSQPHRYLVEMLLDRLSKFYPA